MKQETPMPETRHAFDINRESNREENSHPVEKVAAWERTTTRNTA